MIYVMYVYVYNDLSRSQKIFLYPFPVRVD